MSKLLKITATDGTYTLVPDSNVIQISAAGPTFSQGLKVRGKITGVKYLDGIAAASTSITVVAAIPAYNGTNTRYQYGCILDDGSFDEYLSN